MGKYLFDSRRAPGAENDLTAQVMTSVPHTEPFPYLETLVLARLSLSLDQPVHAIDDITMYTYVI